MDENGTMSEGGGGDPIIEGKVVIVLWIGALILFLLAPFCWTWQSRELCKRRLRARTWNVEIEEGEFDPEWYTLAVQRYNDARANANRNIVTPLSPEEKEEIRLMYLFRQFSGFSKTLQKKDFYTNHDASDILTLLESSPQDNIRDLERGGNGAVAHSVTSIESFSEEVEEENINPYTDDSNKYISLPAAGVNVSVILEDNKDDAINSNQNQRDVPIGCAVCLCEFEPSVRVTWSSNPQCPHVFHEDCIMNWMLAVGRKKIRPIPGEPEDPPAQTEKDVVNFPMLCPCCRQNFVSPADDEPEETDVPSSNESIDIPPQIGLA